MDTNKLDDLKHLCTRYLYVPSDIVLACISAAEAAAYERGARDMRERAARIADDLDSEIYPTATDIRALPLRSSPPADEGEKS